MNSTIAYDQVAALLGTNIPLLEPCPNFEHIRILRCHFERALQHFLRPQSTQLGWKGLVMLQAMYALLTVNAFHLLIKPGPAADYTRADPNNLRPLMHTKQASADTTFNRQKHYFLLLQNIKPACFKALNSSVNDAYKVSDDPTIQGWHMGMTTEANLDQLSTSYGQPTPVAMEINNAMFFGQYSTAYTPKVLFRCIKNCTEIAIMGNNPYTDCQLINNAVLLLLTTGLY
jgi:hypothetical protein